MGRSRGAGGASPSLRSGNAPPAPREHEEQTRLQKIRYLTTERAENSAPASVISASSCSHVFIVLCPPQYTTTPRPGGQPCSDAASGPARGVPMPSYGAAMPGHPTLMPGHAGARPGHGAVMPGHGSPMPGHGGVMPGHGSPRPGHGVVMPGYGGSRPGHGSLMPGHGTVRTGLLNRTGGCE